jgi:hypothetical protein
MKSPHSGILGQAVYIMDIADGTVSVVLDQDIASIWQLPCWIKNLDVKEQDLGVRGGAENLIGFWLQRRVELDGLDRGNVAWRFIIVGEGKGRRRPWDLFKGASRSHCCYGRMSATLNTEHSLCEQREQLRAHQFHSSPLPAVLISVPISNHFSQRPSVILYPSLCVEY